MMPDFDPPDEDDDSDPDGWSIDRDEDSSSE